MTRLTLPRFTSNDKPHIGVSLDEADRKTIIIAGCCAIHNAGGRAWEIGEWRRRASDWDLTELIARTGELGVDFFLGGAPFALPLPIRARRK